MTIISLRRVFGHRRRFLRLGAVLAAAWCVMALTHEAGHLVGGWLAGGTLREAELRPWRLPHSRFDPDPRPLVTLWAGPLLGVAVPIAVALLVRSSAVRFIADFCLLANGLYLALGAIMRAPHLDATRILAHGGSPAAIALYCAVTILLGYPRFRRDCIDILSSETESRLQQGTDD